MGEVLTNHLQAPRERPDTRGFLAFALLCVGVVWESADGTFQPAWLSWAGLAVALALYAVLVTPVLPMRPATGRWALAGLATVVVGMGARFGEGWLYLFPLLAIACATVLYGRAVRVVLAALTAVTALVVWRTGGTFETVMAFGWGTFSLGLVISVILHLQTVIAELNETRQRLAEAAVAEERLRFARDLHDLLGHTLSVIVVKAEAVRRLVDRDPGQAARQAADIETVGRQALTEVREAVTGYREDSLATELDRARDALEAAGVAVTIRRDGPPLPARSESLLSWVVREAATNILRHSVATTACFAITDTTLTIRDNGTAEAPAARGGSGLRGLSERLAMAGGSVEAGPLPEGGFEVVARLPEPRA